MSYIYIFFADAPSGEFSLDGGPVHHRLAESIMLAQFVQNNTSSYVLTDNACIPSCMDTCCSPRDKEWTHRTLFGTSILN